MKKIFTLATISFLFIFSQSLNAQKKRKDVSWQDIEKDLQTQLILASPGDTIFIGAGYYRFKGSLSMDELEDVVIQGAGMDRTILSWAKQTDGAEGIKISNSANIHLRDFTVEDTKGDAIKVQDTEGISFFRVKTDWLGKPDEKNGSYGFYPVQCGKVRIQECLARGASDAGIYVGQSRDIVVENCIATENVAGIEIENSVDAVVRNCEAYGNTGGILVFDMPNLTVKKGGNVLVMENRVYENNLRNFAPEGNIVGQVPPGTGIMILATSQVEIMQNQITGNKTLGCGIISWEMTQKPLTDSLYDPYPTSIYIHDNTFKKKKRFPTLKNDFGKLFFLKFGRKVPDIIYDGVQKPGTLNSDGTVQAEFKICIRENSGATFANMDAENGFKNISRDLKPHDCKLSIHKAGND